MHFLDHDLFEMKFRQISKFSLHDKNSIEFEAFHLHKLALVFSEAHRNNGSLQFQLVFVIGF
jgi:hypothetical protein